MVISIPDPAQRIITLSKSVGQDTVRVTIPVNIVRKAMEEHHVTDMGTFVDEFAMQLFQIEGAYGFRFVKKGDVL